MNRYVLLVAGWASLSAACIAGAEDGAAEPGAPSAGALQFSGPQGVPNPAILAESARVARFDRATAITPPSASGDQTWRAALPAVDDSPGELTRATFNPEAFAAARDVRVWMGVEK